MSKELQNRLSNFEAEPPAKLWDKIVATLDTETEEHFPEKLFNFQANPPKHVWDNIEKTLNESQTPVIPIKKRFATLYHYGSAAAVLIATALFLNLFFNKQSSGNLAGSANTNKQSIPSSIQPTNTKPESVFEKENDSKKGTDDYAFLRPRRDRNDQLRNIPSLAPKSRAVSMARYSHVIVPTNVPVVKSQVLDRYIILPQTSGGVIRLSKKLYTLFACADNNSEDCKQNIQSIQKRMASSAMMASTDFNGMLDLLQTVNKQ